MKKWLALFFCFAVMFALPGCGESASSGRNIKLTPGVNDVLESKMAEEDGINNISSQNADSVADTAVDNAADIDSSKTESDRQSNIKYETSEAETVIGSGTALNTSEGIDVDLTALSSTMVYSEVFNMMVSPDSYIGKKVKMYGMFALYHDEAADKNYYACIVKDATACCSQGIEFVLTEDYTYPDDYPELGENICVIGIFDTYQEGEYTYCTLRDARLA